MCERYHKVWTKLLGACKVRYEIRAEHYRRGLKGQGVEAI